MQSINSTQGQWLGDVAIKHAGTIEALFSLAVLNNASPTESLKAGTVNNNPKVPHQNI